MQRLPKLPHKPDGHWAGFLWLPIGERGILMYLWEAADHLVAKCGAFTCVFHDKSTLTFNAEPDDILLIGRIFSSRKPPYCTVDRWNYQSAEVEYADVRLAKAAGWVTTVSPDDLNSLRLKGKATIYFRYGNRYLAFGAEDPQQIPWLALWDKYRITYGISDEAERQRSNELSLLQEQIEKIDGPKRQARRTTKTVPVTYLTWQLIPPDQFRIEAVSGRSKKTGTTKARQYDRLRILASKRPTGWMVGTNPKGAREYVAAVYGDRQKVAADCAILGNACFGFNAQDDSWQEKLQRQKSELRTDPEVTYLIHNGRFEEKLDAFLNG